MYAIFMNGGKQYKVKKGQIIKLEKLNNSVQTQLKFETVLMISDNKEVKIGQPILLDSYILADIVCHGRNKKINIIKFNRRKHYKKHQGHRQSFTKVLITEIHTYQGVS
ncbi:50S ribosomal protein L21 [Buchnera aphidicola]|uniref:Large ribosomal subunit protein bL21 n=1 Tax=Buchnera aphidicola subsp. Melaphis rhois TaxID=118103 RepID=A0A4D6Y2M5_BUCMH|nr:50S ribosomal protein L21 [Buchnera aphidicola]QCI23367.1 50S ribosomal protein L21 [Buchnera aphidicola (Melaphis rhois)]